MNSLLISTKTISHVTNSYKSCQSHKQHISFPMKAHRGKSKSQQFQSQILIITKVSNFDMTIVDMSYYLGKGIILYTMFFCGLNYFLYRSLREEQEKNDEKDDDM